MNVSKLFRHNKRILSPWARSRVYRLHCSDCSAVSIEDTSRQFGIRVREHLDKSHLIEPHYSSAFAEHIAEIGHHSSAVNVSFLHFKDGWKKRLAVENMEIHRRLLNNKFVVVNRIQPDHDDFVRGTACIFDGSTLCDPFFVICIYLFLFVSLVLLHSFTCVHRLPDGGRLTESVCAFL